MRRLIFIDEAWAKTNMTRLRVRAPRGRRAIGKAPHGHWKTTTLIAALGIEGVRCATVVDGVVNRVVFEAFVEQTLAPELRPGDLVVMGNLSSHKTARTREPIKAAGARLLFLPPYSPHRNDLLQDQAAAPLAGLPQPRRPLASDANRPRRRPSDAGNRSGHCGFTLHDQ